MTRPNFSLRIIDSIFFVALFAILLSFSVNRNVSPESVIWSDAEGYYRYLPALFIDKSVHNLQERHMSMRRNEKGEIVMKYTCGVAYFSLPFFYAAHVYAHVFHYPTSGFSNPYYYAMMICGVFWGIIGLYLLKRLLLIYFSRTVTWTVLLCILFGTNLFHYITRSPGMSHVYSFALVAGLLLLTDSYYRTPTKMKVIALALLMGWLILIRPTNCVLVIFLLLYRVSTMEAFKERLVFLRSHVAGLALALPFLILPMVPQCLYWHEMYSKWVTYSYEGESFIYWKHPKIAEVLFDSQNGLFIYSPVLIFMVIGLFVGWRDRRSSAVGTSLSFIIFTYLFASWWAWWFGAAFGHRCYIDIFAVMALPMAVCFERILALRNWFITAPIAILVAAGLYYGVGMSLLFDKTGVWDGKDWQWNFEAWHNQVKHVFW